MAQFGKNSIFLKYDCSCSTIVIEKNMYDAKAEYNISIQDSHLYHECNTLLGRIRRALKILFGKPIYYNDIYIGNEHEMAQLNRELTNLINSSVSE